MESELPVDRILEEAASDTANRIVRKLWSCCNVLRDDGLSCQDYLEQLTFLLFLERADERSRLTGQTPPTPGGHRRKDLAAPHMEGAELERHYRETLCELGTRGGMFSLIFERAMEVPAGIAGAGDSRRTYIDHADRDLPRFSL